MEVVARILLEKGMGMKAGKFMTLQSCTLAEVTEVVVETVQLLSSGWRVVRRHELKIWSRVVQGKD